MTGIRDLGIICAFTACSGMPCQLARAMFSV
jgi:hypothetical protein